MKCLGKCLAGSEHSLRLDFSYLSGDKELNYQHYVPKTLRSDRNGKLPNLVKRAFLVLADAFRTGQFHSSFRGESIS